MVDGDGTARRRIAFFRGADAQDQAVTGMRGPLVMSEETAAGLRRMQQATTAPGSSSRLLARVPGGLSLMLLWAKPGFLLPRHSHDADCLYYVQSGSILMGARALNAGDSFFVPAHTVYTYAGGPEGAEVLEIRHGVDSYETHLSDQPPARWAQHEAVVRAQAPLWATMTTPPVLAHHRPDADDAAADERDSTSGRRSASPTRATSTRCPAGRTTTSGAPPTR